MTVGYGGPGPHHPPQNLKKGAKESKTSVKFKVHHTNSQALSLKADEIQLPIRETLVVSNGTSHYTLSSFD